MKYMMPLVCVVMACAVSSCTLWKQLQQQKPAVEKTEEQMPPPQYLGTVHQVYPAQKFALLRIIGPVPAAGVTVITHPADGSTARMGNLAVAGDATPRNGMVAADIRAGVVVAGDRVFLYRKIAQPTAEEQKTPTPAEPTEAPPLPVAPQRVAPPVQPVVAPAAAPQPVEEPPAPSAAPTAPVLPGPAAEVPSYLKDVPTDVSEWD